MLKAALIIALVLAALVGGILTLRSTTRAGMPNEDVLKRATRRARELDAAEKDSDGER